MFPYLTPSTKNFATKADLQAVQATIGNLQSSVLSYLNYAAAEIITIPNELNKPTVVNAGLIIFNFTNTNTSSQSTGILVNGTKVWATNLFSDNNATVTLYFKGGESVYFDSSNLDVGCLAWYIPFAVN